MRYPSGCRTTAAFLCVFASLLGCNSAENVQPDDNPPTPQPRRVDGMSAADIMGKMVAAYRDADGYFDNAVYGEHFVLASDGVLRQGLPVSVSISWKRPNKFRIARVEVRPDGEPRAAIVACDGEDLEALISELEPQRLSLPAPDVATQETITPDPLLRQALFPVPLQDMFPQLALLLADGEQSPWPLAAPESLVLLPEKNLLEGESEPVPCYRIEMQTTAGPQICWIHKQSFLLLRIELPGEELRKQLYPDHDFLEFCWRFDFYDATINPPLPDEVFRFEFDETLPPPELVDAFSEPSSSTKSEEQESDASTAEKEVDDDAGSQEGNHSNPFA